MIPEDWIEQSTIDGLVTLLLPPTWTAEDEEDDGTTAFADEDDETGGVLRVTPMVYSSDSDITEKQLPRLLAKRGPLPARIGDDRFLLRKVEEDEEDGEQIVQVTWEMVHRLTEREVVILMASYTLGEAETLESVSARLESLEAAVRTCEIDVD